MQKKPRYELLGPLSVRFLHALLCYVGFGFFFINHNLKLSLQDILLTFVVFSFSFWLRAVSCVAVHCLTCALPGYLAQTRAAVAVMA